MALKSDNASAIDPFCSSYISNQMVSGVGNSWIAYLGRYHKLDVEQPCSPCRLWHSYSFALLNLHSLQGKLGRQPNRKLHGLFVHNVLVKVTASAQIASATGRYFTDRSLHFVDVGQNLDGKVFIAQAILPLLLADKIQLCTYQNWREVFGYAVRDSHGVLLVPDAFPLCTNQGRDDLKTSKQDEGSKKTEIGDILLKSPCEGFVGCQRQSRNVHLASRTINIELL